MLTRAVTPKPGKTRPGFVANAHMRWQRRTRRVEEAEDSSVVAWRAKRLRAAGFGDALARALAADRGVDLHAVLELIDSGCPPPLAARIVAPLDVEWRPCRAGDGC